MRPTIKDRVTSSPRRPLIVPADAPAGYTTPSGVEPSFPAQFTGGRPPRRTDPTQARGTTAREPSHVEEHRDARLWFNQPRSAEQELALLQKHAGDMLFALSTRAPANCFPGFANADHSQTRTRNCDFASLRIYRWRDLKTIWARLQALRTPGYSSRQVLGAFLPFTQYDLDKQPPPPEVEAWLEDLGICQLPKAVPLVHSTKREEIVQILDSKKELFRFNRAERTSCWMFLTYPGHSVYGGGWFTFGTPYGGPEFGLNLKYKVRETCAVLFVPNQYGKAFKDFLRTGQSPYFDSRMSHEERAILTQYVTEDQFSGSHIITQPRDSAGIQPVRHENRTSYADAFAKRMSHLQINGYISCDECEVFLAHAAMVHYGLYLDGAWMGQDSSSGQPVSPSILAKMRDIWWHHCLRWHEPSIERETTRDDITQRQNVNVSAGALPSKNWREYIRNIPTRKPFARRPVSAEFALAMAGA